MTARATCLGCLACAAANRRTRDQGQRGEVACFDCAGVDFDAYLTSRPDLEEIQRIVQAMDPAEAGR